MKFTVYSKNGCPYCTKVEKVLQLTELQHDVLKLGTDFDREEFYSKFGEGSTFPKVRCHLILVMKKPLVVVVKLLNS